MPQMYVNPYNPTTPIGSALQNIATMLFAGPTPREQDEKAANADLRRRHAALYDEQTRTEAVKRAKLEAEARDAATIAGMRTPEAINRRVAARLAMPLARVQAVRNITNNSPTGMPRAIDPEARNIGELLYATEMGLADKTVNPYEVERAIRMQSEDRMRDDIVGGNLDPTRVGQAVYATSGKAPFSGEKHGSTNLVTGAQTLNPIGVEAQGAERALTGQRNASAANQISQRDLNVERRRDIERGTAHPFETVIRKDAEGNDMIGSDGTVHTELVPRIRAESRTPWAKPKTDAGTGANGGSTVTESTTTTEEIKPLPIRQSDYDLIAETAKKLSGGATLKDPRMAASIQKRAELYYSTPGSPHYGNHAGAAQAAFNDHLPGGASRPFPFMSPTPDGGYVENPGDIAITGPTTRTKTVEKSKTKTPAGKGGAAAPKPTAQSSPSAAKASGRPQGKSDQQLIDEANAAIRKGAKRDDVMKRLQQWGVTVN